MATIKLSKITISYFKGIHNLTLNLNNENAEIHGRNGSGKTSIADAIQWTLFGKDSHGRTQFKIRTMDADGNYLSNVETYVELELLINGVQRTIRKQLLAKTDVFSKEISSTAKYYVDGQVYTKKDYDEFIRSIITEDAFRIVTSPLHFFTLDWKKQRSLLVSLTHEPQPAEINANHEFDIVEQALASGQFASLEALRKHVDYQLKQIKSELDNIPIQISEQKTTMPECYDWDELEKTVSTMQTALDKDRAELSNLQHSSADEIRNKSLRKQIEMQQRRLDTMRESATRMVQQSVSEYEAERSRLNTLRNRTKQDIEDFLLKIQGLNNRMAQVNLSIKEEEVEQEKIRTEWKQRVNVQYKHQFTEEDLTCPVCGQSYPASKIQELRQRNLEAFNATKAKAMEELNERARICKINQQRAKEALEQFGRDLQDASAKQKASRDYLTRYEHDYEEFIKTKPKTVDELLAINPGYSDAMKRIAELRQELDTPSSADIDTTEQQDALRENIISLEVDIASIQAKLANKALYLRHQSRITELQDKQVTLRRQYEQYLQQQDQCHGYELAYGSLLEADINRHFHDVQFSLFKHLVNGSTEPYCEPLVDGIPVNTNVNSAAVLNAGLDICNTFARQLNACAPVIIDNAESSLNIIPTEGQQLLLYVDDVELQVK